MDTSSAAKLGGRPLGAKDVIPRASKPRLRAALNGESEEYKDIVDAWFAVVRAGLSVTAADRLGFCKLVMEAGMAKEIAGGTGKGLTIILPRGGGYDPMARESKTPERIERASSPAPALEASVAAAPVEDTGETLDDFLGSGDERLELQPTDEPPTSCPYCAGRGVAGPKGERSGCRFCEGTGHLLNRQ